MVYEQSDFVDDLPENCDYFDEGCNLAPSCLNCPFPFCIHDVSPDGTSPFKKWRDDEIVRRTAAGIAVEELELTFGISRRLIFQIIKDRYKNKHP